MAGVRRSPQSLRVASVRARREGNGFGYAQIAQIQRARILAAMFDVASERGAANVSVAHVVERSGVSRRTFYETFSDREECFFAAFEDALALVSQRVLPAYAAERKWSERIGTGSAPVVPGGGADYRASFDRGVADRWRKDARSPQQGARPGRGGGR